MTASVPAIKTRKMTRSMRVALILLTTFAAIAGIAHAQVADLAVINARIYTENPKQPRASAIAVRAERILAVGDDVSRFIGPATKTIDAKGAPIIPGFIDSHGHVRGLGDMLAEIDLRGIRSQKEVEDKVRAAAKQFKAGDWIR